MPRMSRIERFIVVDIELFITTLFRFLRGPEWRTVDEALDGRMHDLLYSVVDNWLDSSEEYLQEVAEIIFFSKVLDRNFDVHAVRGRPEPCPEPGV